MTVDLVCEGSCSPDLAAVDVEVRRFRIEHRRAEGLPIPAALATRLRAASVHQPHHMISDEIAQCLMCGRQRRYGRV